VSGRAVRGARLHDHRSGSRSRDHRAPRRDNRASMATAPGRG